MGDPAAGFLGKHFVRAWPHNILPHERVQYVVLTRSRLPLISPCGQRGALSSPRVATAPVISNDVPAVVNVAALDESADFLGHDVVLPVVGVIDVDSVFARHEKAVNGVIGDGAETIGIEAVEGVAGEGHGRIGGAGGHGVSLNMAIARHQERNALH
jgi:hypothetical protein